MNLLKRESAPISPAAWKAIDDEPRRALKVKLAARKVVDVDGPFGWELGAVNTGRLAILPNQPAADVGAGVRETLPLVELRTSFQLEQVALDSITRGLQAPDLAPVADAAERIAKAEDQIVFRGYSEAQVPGMLESGSHDAVAMKGEAAERFGAVVQAWQTDQSAGVEGQYGLVMDERMYSETLQSADDGYPVVQRISDLIGGPIVRAGTLDGGALVSLRGATSSSPSARIYRSAT